MKQKSHLLSFSDVTLNLSPFVCFFPMLLSCLNQ